VVNYSVVDDVGRVLNPLMLEGQVHGGVAQGIGQALMEHAVFDPETGQLVTGSFMDYAMPHARSVPFLTVRTNEFPCRTNPLGVKGAGEAGAIAAPPTVINAVVDALAPFGVEHVDMPARPETIWRLCRRGRRPAAA
jgi:carbon-monoxide dehydrogenase large subunit